MSESTIRGVDVGSYVALTNAGVKYYDYDGKDIGCENLKG